MKQLIAIISIFILTSCSSKGIIFEKQGYIYEPHKYDDTLFQYKCKNTITGSYETVYKKGRFNVGDQIDW